MKDHRDHPDTQAAKQKSGSTRNQTGLDEEQLRARQDRNHARLVDGEAINIIDR